jgi:hypothetical protein
VGPHATTVGLSPVAGRSAGGLGVTGTW